MVQSLRIIKYQIWRCHSLCLHMFLGRTGCAQYSPQCTEALEICSARHEQDVVISMFCRTVGPFFLYMLPGWVSLALKFATVRVRDHCEHVDGCREVAIVCSTMCAWRVHGDNHPPPVFAPFRCFQRCNTVSQQGRFQHWRFCKQRLGLGIPPNSGGDRGDLRGQEALSQQCHGRPTTSELMPNLEICCEVSFLARSRSAPSLA